jgi:asparagine synthase (glutamine-hydrolysing)
MCGISGIIFKKPELINKQIIEYLNSLLYLRGPDYNDIYINDPKSGIMSNIMLGHNRLSIIDLDNRSNQPFYFKNFIMVFNGEIYNYQELKKDLINEFNEIFTTNSDTEVLIKLFYYYDINDAINKLEGMFSIILYDNLSNTIYLIRDRLGEKLLYYYEDENIFIISSNPGSIAKTVNKYFNKKWLINKYSIFYYLSSGMIPTRMSLFDEIHGLKPGHYIKYNINNFTSNYIKYWNPEFNKKSNYYDLLENSINKCEISDVDTKILFSGGIDSGIISFFEKKSSYITLHTDELELSKKFLENLNKQDKQYVITNDFILNNLDRAINEQYNIINNSGLLTRSSFAVILTGLYLKEFHPNTKCIITGNGGDELFYGYKIMHINNTKYNQHINEKFIFNQFIIPLNNTYGDYFKDIYTPNFNSNIIQELDIPDNLNKDNIPRWLELKTYLLNDLNIDSDIIFMHYSIECRSPFLNHKLVEYCLSDEPSNFFYKYDNKNFESYIQNSKKPLKEILLTKLDKSNVFRYKYGYGFDDNLYINKYKNFAKDFLKRNIISYDCSQNQSIILIGTLEIWFKSFENIIIY